VFGLDYGVQEEMPLFVAVKVSFRVYCLEEIAIRDIIISIFRLDLHHPLESGWQFLSRNVAD